MGPETSGTTDFRPCESDGAWNLCIAELAKVVGAAEAGKPQWVRRLALSAKGSQPLILVTHCPWVSPMDPASTCPWLTSDQGHNPLATEQRAHPVGEGVALLASAQNPETEIARRRGLMQAKKDRDAAAVAALALPAERERKREAELSALRARGLDAWEKLDPATKALYLLAQLLSSKFPPLDAAIRECLAVVERESAEASLPRMTWWKRPSAEELAQHFPPEK